MRKRKDGLCHKCNEPGTSDDGYCVKHAKPEPQSAVPGLCYSEPMQPYGLD